MAGHPGRGDGHSHRGKQPVGHSPERGAANDGRDPHGIPPSGSDGLSDPRDREDRIHGCDRVRRTDHNDVGFRDRLEDSRRRAGVLRALVPDILHLVVPTPQDPVLLEVQIQRLTVLAHRGDPGGHGIVRHRQDPHRHPSNPSQLFGDGRERLARREPRRSIEMGGKVQIAETEPRPLGEETPQLLGGSEGLALPPPPPFPIHDSGQPVRHGVEVGRDVQTVDDEVVPGVHHDGEVIVGDGANHSAQESSRSDAAGQGRDFHGDYLAVFATGRGRP